MHSEDSRDDADVFAALYPALRRIAGAIRPIGCEPDDLVQEALTRTLTLGPLSELDHPLAYLRKVIVRVSINAERSRRRSAARAGRVTDRELGRVDAYPSDVAELGLISAKERAVLFLTVIEGCSYREAADTIGCSQPAARQMASRALRSLRERLDATFMEATEHE